MLPTDLLQVRRVEHPSGLYRTPAPFASGDASPDSPLVDGLGGPTLPELLYDVWAGALVLSPPPATSDEPIVVRYVATCAEPSSDASVLDLAAQDEDALVLFVCGRALRWIGMDEAKRQRFERQRGADPHTLRQDYDREYRTLVRQRRGRIATRRLAIR
jgi:hypothetical protein